MLSTRGIPTFFGCLSLDVPTAKFNLYVSLFKGLDANVILHINTLKALHLTDKSDFNFTIKH